MCNLLLKEMTGRGGGGRETTGRQSLLKQKESQVPVTTALCEFTKGAVGQGTLSGSFPLIAVTD